MRFRSGHISFDTLADLAEGRIAPAERAALAAHLEACPRCAANHTWLVNTTAQMRADELVDAPQAVVNSAIALFASRTAAGQPGLLRRIVAALSFDSGMPQQAFGVRSGLPSARQLLLSAEPYEIDLRVAQQSGALVLSGQVLGPCSGGEVELRGPTTARASLNRQCEWTLSPVAAGTYALVLRLGDAEIVLPELDLSP